MLGSPICFDCIYYLDNYKCKAFPNGIPRDIVFSEADHHKPYPGDGGIQYKEETKK